MSEPLVLDKMIWVVTDNPEKAQLIRTLLAYEDREILRSFKDLQFETLSSAAEARERLQHTRPKIIVQFAPLRFAGDFTYYVDEADHLLQNYSVKSLIDLYETTEVMAITPHIKERGNRSECYGIPWFSMHLEEPLNTESKYLFQRFVHVILAYPPMAAF